MKFFVNSPANVIISNYKPIPLSTFAGQPTRDAVKDVLCCYVDFYNRQRPCFAIVYDTTDNYCKRFYRGELEKKDTFSKRILTEEPKFVQKRKDTEKNPVPCRLFLTTATVS